MPNLGHTPEYRAWQSMRDRCNNKRARRYADYGGRGIAVDPSWSTYGQFFADMGPRPSPRHSLDRIDNDQNYCKENCRWATAKEQACNRRSNVLFRGEKVVHIADRLGIKVTSMRHRIWRYNKGLIGDKELMAQVQR